MTKHHAIKATTTVGCMIIYAWPIACTQAWMAPIRGSYHTSFLSSPIVTTGALPQRPPSFARFMVESFDLMSNTKLSENHEDVGQELAESVQRMLDNEWMPQEIHFKMGQIVKMSYMQCRQSGQSDLMTIMTTVADNLNAHWHEYDAETFVNAWDIANYVSDWLVFQTGAEGCECANKIY